MPLYSHKCGAPGSVSVHPDVQGRADYAQEQTAHRRRMREEAQRKARLDEAQDHQEWSRKAEEEQDKTDGDHCQGTDLYH